MQSKTYHADGTLVFTYDATVDEDQLDAAREAAARLPNPHIFVRKGIECSVPSQSTQTSNADDRDHVEERVWSEMFGAIYKTLVPNFSDEYTDEEVTERIAGLADLAVDEWRSRYRFTPRSNEAPRD